LLVAVDCLRAPDPRFGGDSGLRQELAKTRRSDRAPYRAVDLVEGRAARLEPAVKR